MTLAQAKQAVAKLGYSLSKRDGEYRLAPLNGSPAEKEAKAYYSDDIEDVIGTATYQYVKDREIHVPQMFVSTLH